MTKRAFGDLELEILQLLKGGKRMTVKEIQALLGGQDKYTTVMTVMNRLSEKKRLLRERVGLQYEYWIAENEDKSLTLVQHLKKKLFGVRPSALVSYLIQSDEEISDQELAEMEEMIQNAKEKRRKYDV